MGAQASGEDPDRARLDEPHPAGRNARRRGHRPRQAGLVGPVRGRRQPHSVSFVGNQKKRPGKPALMVA